MFDLIGSYPVKIDNKGRMRLPTKLLEKLGDGGTLTQFCIARGVGKCLSLYTEATWAEETHKLRKLDLNVMSNLNMVRSFYHDATEVKLDSADRIPLTQMQRDVAEIKEEVVIYTFLGKIEIWSKENYKNGMSLDTADYISTREKALVGEPKKEKADE